MNDLYLKRSFIAVFILTLVWGELPAQERSAFTPVGMITMGANFGSIFGEVNFIPEVEQEGYVGYAGGLSLKIQSETYASLLFEVNYTKRGWSEDLDGANTYERTITAVEVPILTMFHIRTSDRSRVNIMLGPQLSFIANNKETIALTTIEEKEYYRADLDHDFLFSIPFGLGIERKTGIGYFNLDFRFNFAFTDIFANERDDFFTKSRLDQFEIKLSYLFDFLQLRRNRR